MWKYNPFQIIPRANNKKLIYNFYWQYCNHKVGFFSPSFFTAFLKQMSNLSTILYRSFHMALPSQGLAVNPSHSLWNPPLLKVANYHRVWKTAKRADFRGRFEIPAVFELVYLYGYLIGTEGKRVHLLPHLLPRLHLVEYSEILLTSQTVLVIVYLHLWPKDGLCSVLVATKGMMNTKTMSISQVMVSL